MLEEGIESGEVSPQGELLLIGDECEEDELLEDNRESTQTGLRRLMELKERILLARIYIGKLIKKYVSFLSTFAQRDCFHQFLNF